MVRGVRAGPRPRDGRVRRGPRLPGEEALLARDLVLNRLVDVWPRVPSFREIAQSTDLAVGTVHNAVRWLESQGALWRQRGDEGGKRARGIVLTAKAWTMTGKTPKHVCCRHCGGVL